MKNKNSFPMVLLEAQMAVKKKKLMLVYCDLTQIGHASVVKLHTQFIRLCASVEMFHKFEYFLACNTVHGSMAGFHEKFS